MDKQTLTILNAEIGHTNPLMRIPKLEMKTGSVSLLVGNNGTGKTTLLKSILRQIPLLKGEIQINGKNIERIPHKNIAKSISMVFSKPKIPSNYTVFDTVSLGKFVHYPYYFQLSKADIAEVEHILECLDIATYRNTPLIHLSDGNLQKTFIGLALAQNTPFIVLDEPTTHLDKKNKTLLLNLLKNISLNMEKAILLSSHDWHIATNFCDFIWLVKEKCFYHGLAEDIIWEHPDFFQEKNNLLNTNYRPPIFSSESEKAKLINTALQKKFNTDLSQISIDIHNPNSMILSVSQNKYKVNRISEIIEIISKKGY